LVECLYELHQKLILKGQTKNLFAKKFSIKSNDQNSEYQFIIREDSHFRMFWNSLLILFIAYTCTYMPYKLSFITEETTANHVVEWIVDIFFWFDLIMNFFSSYEEPNGTVVTDHKKIAKAYLTSWFLLDIIACTPT
jgi:hypothetical protein